MKCPFCAEEVQDEAIKCKHCGEWFSLPSRDKNAQTQEPAPPRAHLAALSGEQLERFREATRSLLPEQNVPLPIIIRDLSLSKDDFVFRAVRRPYNRVTNLFVCVRRTTANLITNSYVEFKIRTVDEALIGMTIGEGFLNDKKYQTALRAVSLLRSKTYDSRRAYYLNLLTSQGFFDYKFHSSQMHIPSSVRITADGVIEKGRTRVDLKEARKRGVIMFHTSVRTWSGNYSASNPYEIAVSEKPDPRYVFSLRINALWDYDVIASIIDALSKSPPGSAL